MEIVDLSDEHTELFCSCLEDWSDEAREAGPKRRLWVERSRRCGLRGKLAVDDDGTMAGMIQYLPIEHSFVGGSGLYVVQCIWVHGHDRGRGNRQGRGMGRALLDAAEQDAGSLGAQGMVAWGLWLPFWMKAAWFRKHGYRRVQRQGVTVLLWKPFCELASPPHWYHRTHKQPEKVRGKVTVTAFVNGWCMGQNLTYERAKRAAAEVGDAVVFREVDTSSREAIAEWGISDLVMVNGKAISHGAPLCYDKILRLITKRARRLPRS